MTTTQPIHVGQKIPSFVFFTMKDDTPTTITSDEVFLGCSKTHCPSFVAGIDDLKKKGIAGVYCTAVNDVFVLSAWGKQQKAQDKIVFLADGSGKFTASIGMNLDLTEKGLGIRSQRYAMIVDNGIVQWIGIDPPGQIANSTSEAVLSHL